MVMMLQGIPRRLRCMLLQFLWLGIILSTSP